LCGSVCDSEVKSDTGVIQQIAGRALIFSGIHRVPSPVVSTRIGVTERLRSHRSSSRCTQSSEPRPE
jgi:hypothetical protein